MISKRTSYATSIKAAIGTLIFSLAIGVCAGLATADDYEKVVDDVQPKIVKIYGAGGLRGMEAYQSGFLISADGLVLTVWSYVLDTDEITAILNDGQKLTATMVGYDPRLEIAVLKIEGKELPHFRMEPGKQLAAGARVFAFSNLFGVATGNEQASVQQGIVSARTNLAARRGAFPSAHEGPVYLLDAMVNNPGAAGGAVTDHRGNLVGLIGKELKSRKIDVWINFAIPVSELAPSVDDIRNGRPPQNREPSPLVRDPVTARLLGFKLVPNVVRKTPPFVDRVVGESSAELAGLRVDDLIVEVNGIRVGSCQEVHDQFKRIDRGSRVELTVQRDRKFQTIELQRR